MSIHLCAPHNIAVKSWGKKFQQNLITVLHSAGIQGVFFILE